MAKKDKTPPDKIVNLDKPGEMQRLLIETLKAFYPEISEREIEQFIEWFESGDREFLEHMASEDGWKHIVKMLKDWKSGKKKGKKNIKKGKK